ncbi:spinster family MFS transporter [Paraburkholderia phytofirmans]|uniref:spinster family MFS transporter n=1 Tax=Paraburkholderia phytofirmans TaxID=261302 RepID=UPI0038BCAC72
MKDDVRTISPELLEIDASVADDAAVKRPLYPWYVLAVLLLIYGIQMLDRQVVAILLEPIRHEFGLDDKQLGLLGSLSFALAYAVTCVPLGIAADRIARKHLLSAVLVVWSLFTAVSGLAHSFWQLLLARIVVGGAESGNNPAAMSLLADYFGPRNRATAVGIYFLGSSLGLFGGFLIGGTIAPVYGWRAALLVAGVPGLILAALLLLTVREPQRGALDSVDREQNAEMRSSLKDVLRWIWSQRSARLLVATNISTSFTVAGFITWMASFLIRSHGMDAHAVGLSLGFGLGTAIAIGSVAGGMLADRVGRSKARFRTMLIGLCVLASVPVFATALIVSDARLAIGLLSIACALNAMQYGPTYSLLLTLVPSHMRATSNSVVFFLSNFVGYGVGPFVVGVLSDAMVHSFAGESLRISLGTVLTLQVVAVMLAVVAGATVERDLVRVKYCASK